MRDFTQTTEIKEANPADVASIDAIMKAVYDVISGDAGQKRVNRGDIRRISFFNFRSLRHCIKNKS